MAQLNDPGEHGTREPLQAPLAYTAEQAAGVIGGSCKASWLKKLAREKKIPHLKIGGAYNFTDEQIRQIIAYFEVPVPTPQPAATPSAAGRTPAKRAPAAPADLPSLLPGTASFELRPRQPRRRGLAQQQGTQAHKDDEGGQASVAW